METQRTQDMLNKIQEIQRGSHVQHKTVDGEEREEDMMTVSPLETKAGIKEGITHLLTLTEEEKILMMEARMMLEQKVFNPAITLQCQQVWMPSWAALSTQRQVD